MVEEVARHDKGEEVIKRGERRSWFAHSSRGLRGFILGQLCPVLPRLSFGLPSCGASRARSGRPHPWPGGG